jgi:hypothetical protein
MDSLLHACVLNNTIAVMQVYLDNGGDADRVVHLFGDDWSLLGMKMRLCLSFAFCLLVCIEFVIGF